MPYRFGDLSQNLKTAIKVHTHLYRPCKFQLDVIYHPNKDTLLTFSVVFPKECFRRTNLTTLKGE